MKARVTSCIFLVFSIMATRVIAQETCACPMIYLPVCGDDGVDYSNACAAECNDAKVLYEGECIWKWVDYAIESPHPYPNDYVDKWEIRTPEKTVMVRLEFPYIITEQGYDFLEFYNDNGLLDTRSGVHFDHAVTLATDNVYLRFVTDGSVRGWGFEMSGYAYLVYPEENSCEIAGGVCIPVVPGSECKDGYHLEPGLACSGLGAQCCLPDDCISEGEPTLPPYNCCEGLAPVAECLPGESCPSDLRYCVDCGNGSCDPYENETNCAVDCHDPSCDDGTEPLCKMMPPVCEHGDILAYQNNCYRCVDPYTCKPTSRCGGEEKIPCRGRNEICWYQTGEEKYGRCHGRIGDIPVCLAIGTRSEGWYWQETGALIEYAFCDDEMAACFLESSSRSQGWYLVGEPPTSKSLIDWDRCHR